MMKREDVFARLTEDAFRLGAYRAEVISVEEILPDRSFRDACASNACGLYGRCYMCPPYVGEIDDLMAELGRYEYALVYQTVTQLEDSYDFEGMVEAKRQLHPLAQGLRTTAQELNLQGALHLGPGGCGLCETCSQASGEPCRFPDLAMSSPEAYGINVSQLAKTAHMKYINGQDTVTYFGMVLFSLDRKPVTVKVDGRLVSGEMGMTLSEIVKGEKPCGGHGRCGKCKVTAKGALSAPTVGERSVLSAEELARGVRLACLTHALGDCEVETPASPRKAQILTQGTVAEFACKPAFSSYGVAVDIGTTTLAARLYDKEGTLLSEASGLNPQSEWGADVISRIEGALSGKAVLLAEAVRRAVNGLIGTMADDTGIASDAIDGVVITGNTVMLSLLTETDTEPFSHAPFAVQDLFGDEQTAGALGLEVLRPKTAVYLPPCMSAFVGADITCALLATQLCKADTALLADIGTNGELALWHDGRLTVCSTAAGPAFEGVGIAMGMRGAEGAIDRVSLRDGVLTAHVIGETEPVGICGSGLVDAVACLLETERLDESGYLEEESVLLQGRVTLIQKDIRMLQLAKSAICAGVQTLMEQASVSEEELECLWIAGGFGSYLDLTHAVRIGLLPAKPAQRVRLAGNAALGGAAMLLLNGELRAEAKALAQRASVLELSTHDVFVDRYMMGMSLEPV
ncbi:MAG: DUF4445 domain-containing protein [Clostridia bacterium]|nr:DUF4445 domain-containing protein [Clostridia bacterium]